MNKNPKSLKALSENSLEKVAGGGLGVDIKVDEYGELAEVYTSCDKCGRKVKQVRPSPDPWYDMLCDDCFKKL